MRAVTILLLLVVAAAGCATIEYGPLGGKPTARYSYREGLESGTRYVLSIWGPPNAEMSVMQSMWDRRARELCGGNTFTKSVFRAERPTVRYSSYGGTPGAPVLQGFLDCASS
jgi:hypothetical protein